MRRSCARVGLVVAEAHRPDLLIALLAVPVARLGLASLFLGRNRHR
jgi:hypothetical protein